MNALAAAYYPTANRATGVSWANGVGRIGSVLGSMLGGFMLSLGWGIPTVFAIVAIPAFIAGLAIFVMGGVSSPTAADSAAGLTDAFRSCRGEGESALSNAAPVNRAGVMRRSSSYEWRRNSMRAHRCTKIGAR